MSTAVESICNAAWANGLLVIATASVGGPGMGTVAAPAKFKNVIAVSSVDSSDVITPFSSRGPEVELCAPGINVLSTKPGGGYQSWSGTAGACLCSRCWSSGGRVGLASLRHERRDLEPVGRNCASVGQPGVGSAIRLWTRAGGSCGARSFASAGRRPKTVNRESHGPCRPLRAVRLRSLPTAALEHRAGRYRKQCAGFGVVSCSSSKPWRSASSNQRGGYD
jgi:subtilase family protein